MSDSVRPVVTYPRDAILESAQVAAAIGVSEEIVGKMDLPCFYAGKRPRYLWGQVLDVLAARAMPSEGREQPPTRLRRRSMRSAS